MTAVTLFRLTDPIELVSWEFPKLCGFVRERRRAVAAAHRSRCVSTHCINDVFTHTEPQGTSFESMTPSVIWLDFLSVTPSARTQVASRFTIVTGRARLALVGSSSVASFLGL
jgi:hypothetical protein